MEDHCDNAKKMERMHQIFKTLKIQTSAEDTPYQVRFHPVLLLRATLLLLVFLLLSPVAHTFHTGT
jgi:hypothetical protein